MIFIIEKYKKIIGIILLVVCSTIFIFSVSFYSKYSFFLKSKKFIMSSSHDRRIITLAYKKAERTVRANSRIKKRNVFVITICDSNKNFTNSGENEHIEKTTVLLKSAVSLTKEILRFIVLTNNEKLFHILLTELHHTFRPEDFDKLIISNVEMRYPVGREYMEDIFKPCSTARLFLPELLRYDSVIHLDTDTVFLRSPEHLWEEFRNFDDDDVAGMSQTRGWYNFMIDKTRLSFPFYGATGLNAGVFMMNLTRIDDFPGKWNTSYMKELDRYKRLLVVGDQDLLNIVFSKKPYLLYELGCEWNFCGLFCAEYRIPCKRAEKYGIALIHGNANTLHSWQFGVVYENWKNYTMGSPLTNLWFKMDQEMRRTKAVVCGLTNFITIFTKWPRENL